MMRVYDFTIPQYKALLKNHANFYSDILHSPSPLILVRENHEISSHNFSVVFF